MKRKMITLATAILTLSLATACGSETPSTESTATNESVSVASVEQTSKDTSTSVEGSVESSVETTEVLTAKTEVVNGMYVLPEEELINGVCFTVKAPASYVARNLIPYGGLTCQFLYENIGGIVTAPPTNPDEIYNPMVSSLNDLLHYSWTGTTCFIGAGNSIDIDDNKNREVSQGIMNFLSKYNIVDSTGYISPKYGSITIHKKVTTPNGLVIAKNTDKIYEFDFHTDLGNVPTDLSTYKEIGTAAITYRFYFKTADGNFNDLYYVSIYGAEDKVLAAIDEYAAKYGLTQ